MNGRIKPLQRGDDSRENWKTINKLAEDNDDLKRDVRAAQGQIKVLEQKLLKKDQGGEEPVWLP